MPPSLERVVELRRGIRACQRCVLRQEATAPIPPRGPRDAELVIVGEAPGLTEDKEGKPFVGAAGHLLERALKSAGIDPAGVVFANTACCYPKTTKTPEREHIEACATNLRAVLSAWAPTIIVACGKTALSAFYWDLRGDLGLLHGRPLFWSDERFPADGGGRFSATLWPTYHPASALPSRTPKYETTIIEDLKAVVRYHRDGENGWPTDCWVCGGELHDWDPRGLARCEQHAQTQGHLFA